jgi:hypothetical protein
MAVDKGPLVERLGQLTAAWDRNNAQLVKYLLDPDHSNSESKYVQAAVTERNRLEVKIFALKHNWLD